MGWTADGDIYYFINVPSLGLPDPADQVNPGWQCPPGSQTARGPDEDQIRLVLWAHQRLFGRQSGRRTC